MVQCCFYGVCVCFCLFCGVFRGVFGVVLVDGGVFGV